MNFSDDPLADLLSDNSLDNDNFFDAPSGGGLKKLTKQNKAKGKLEDLVGIKEETEPDAQSVRTAAPRIVKQIPSLSMDDADDDELGFDPKRPKSGSGSKKNLFDDLLGPEAKKNIFDDMLNSGEVPKRPASAKPSMSRQSTDTTTDNSQARPKTAAGAGRRSSVSAQSAILSADPLGLFSRDKETNANVSGMSTPVFKKPGTADWLGLGFEMSSKLVMVEPERPSTPRTPQLAKESTPNTKITGDTLHLPDSDEADLGQLTITPPTADNTTQKIMMLNNLSLESIHNYDALQKQEAQLVIATQMKSQERSLMEMQSKQKSQDLKFQELIQQQFQRQQQMEEHIKAQQERINIYLQLMMTQPVDIARTDATCAEVTKETAPEQGRKENREQLLQLETDVKRNLLEKLRLEELVANMKVNYEQEIEMIESSYRKQLKVLEHQSTAVEERLKEENLELREYYNEKLEKLKGDYGIQIATLKQDHEDVLRIQRNSQESEVERIRQVRVLEQADVRDHDNYMESLRMASSDLKLLREGMDTTREREKLLEARERRADDLERRLKIDEEGSEQEKRRLMELVSTLEVQLSRLSKDSAEENWQLRQRMASIDAEKQAFEREKQFHREQMERDEKRIEELKTLQLVEVERLKMDVQQERTRLLVEKQKLEVQHKLHEKSDLNQERIELEAQLQVARDAIKRADKERDISYKQQRELEQRKRDLLERENSINVKEDELMQATSSYRLAINRSQMVEKKVREAEQLMLAKLTLLAKRTHELSEKEAQLSQERVLFAQNRIALHKLKQQIGHSKCTLCKMGVEKVEFSQRIADQNRENHTQQPNLSQSAGQAATPASDLVDRMLDDSINASYRRMYELPDSSKLEYWTTVGLDDDSKKLALDSGQAMNIENMVWANLNIN